MKTLYRMYSSLALNSAPFYMLAVWITDRLVFFYTCKNLFFYEKTFVNKNQAAASKMICATGGTSTLDQKLLSRYIFIMGH